MTAVAALRGDAVAVALGAGRILADAYGRTSTVTHKGVVDLVTDADHASERFVLEELRRLHPDHAVLAEESGASGGDAAWRWIVDPLDGTTNFAHGLPHFSVLIAVQERLGDVFETRLAVTFDPLRDELFVAERGGGATLNGAAIRVSTTRDVVQSLLCTGFAYDRLARTDDNHAEFCRLNLLSQGVRRLGSAGLDLAYVACGRFDGYWEYALHPWDFVGGALLVREAGGVVDQVDGAPLDLGSRSILATNGVLHPTLRSAMLSARALPTGSRDGLETFLPRELHDQVGRSQPGPEPASPSPKARPGP